MTQASEKVHISLSCKGHAHTFDITMTLDNASKNQRFSLPVWAPGSYLVRDFSQHISSLVALENGMPCAVKKLSKNCFELDNLGQRISLSYQVYAFDSSIRAAFIDDSQAFFNGTSLFLRPQGFDEAEYVVAINKADHKRAEHWQVATAMDAIDTDAQGFGRYRAQGYEALVDYPVQISAMKRLSFRVGAVPHEIVLVGDVRPFDEERLIKDLSQLCTYQCAMFGGAPFARYLFIARFEEGGAGGLEHRNSSMLLASPHSLPKIGQGEADNHYKSFLGLCSHEYFHAWNVKRLMPKDFIPLNFDKECYTTLLWLFEGITAYYDDLFLRKAGLICAESYLEILSRNYSRLLKVPGRSVQSLAEASFDAWIKFYRPNENSPNTTVSYYLKGSFVGLMLDLMIRLSTKGQRSLDHVMARAFQLYGHGSGITEHEFFALVKEMSSIDTEDFVRRYIHGMDELPLGELLAAFGIEMQLAPDELALDDKTKMAASLGMKIRLDDHHRAHITYVEQDGAAMEAGLSPHDEIVAIDAIRLDHHTIADLLGAQRPHKPTSLLVARKKVLRSYELLPRPLSQTLCKFSLKRQPTENEEALRNNLIMA